MHAAGAREVEQELSIAFFERNSDLMAVVEFFDGGGFFAQTFDLSSHDLGAAVEDALHVFEQRIVCEGFQALRAVQIGRELGVQIGGQALATTRRATMREGA